MPDYFNSSDNTEADKRTGETNTKRIHNEFSNLFSGISFFEGIFFLQVKEGSLHTKHQQEEYTMPYKNN